MDARGRMTKGAVGLILVLGAILAAAIWLAWDVWMGMEGVAMSTAGVLALIGGAVLTLLLGAGLMALVFYSARHGYDDHQDPDDPSNPFA